MEDVAVIDPGFWKGKRVFVTGHTGFKGSWLSLWLDEMGAHVIGYALHAPTSPSLFESLGLEKRMHSIEADIRDLPTLKSTLAEHQPSIVLHLAAQPLVRDSYADPIETYATNVMGTAHLLEAVRATQSVRAALIVTSDKAYENREWPWGYRENDPMGGHDPYSSSKGCAELVTAAYRSSYFPPARLSEHGVAVATARAGNVIGGGDWARDRLFPDLIRGFIDGRPVEIRNPSAIRPWQHVLESLSGYLTLAQRLFRQDEQACAAWNFGPSESDHRTVSFIADRAAGLWGPEVRWEHTGSEALHEAHHLKLDCSKAKAHLGWTPIWDIETCLDRTVAWYKSVARSEASASERTLEDVHAYMGDLALRNQPRESMATHVR